MKNSNEKLTNILSLVDEFKRLKSISSKETKVVSKTMRDENSIKHSQKSNESLNKTSIHKNFERILRENKKSKAEIVKLLKDNEIKFHLSCFEVMEHNWKENTHSNVLQYLFDYYLVKNGEIFLSEFIKNIPNLENGDKLIEIILKKNYEIIREKSAGKGRIDILILDKKTNWQSLLKIKYLQK